jgi:hypothetical protein
MVEETSMNNNENDENDNILVVNDPDQYPHVLLRGSLANLSALRQGDTTINSTFFAERYQIENNDGSGDDDEFNNSPVLLLESSISASLTVMSSSSSDAATTTTTDGEVYMTKSQLLFVATNDQLEEDWAIGASTIVLHAMTGDDSEENEVEEETQSAPAGVYLQLNNPDNENHGILFGNNGDDDDDNRCNDGLLEITITPVDKNDCQKLFDCLCKLVSLHPIMDDDGDDHKWQGGGGGGFGGFGESNDDDDDLVWAPAAGSSNFGMGNDNEHDDDEDGGGGGGATEEERAAMLERLDNLLVVRPEYETQDDGRFDDADDTDDNHEMEHTEQ